MVLALYKREKKHINFIMGTWLHQEELVGEVSCSWELRVFPTLLTPGGEVSEPEVSEP